MWFEYVLVLALVRVAGWVRGIPRTLRLLDEFVIHEKYGAHEAQVTTLREAVREASASSPELLAAARAELGAVLLGRGEVAEAVTVLRLSLAGSFRSVSERDEARRRLGVALAAQGDTDEAYEVLSRHLSGWPAQRPLVLQELLAIGRLDLAARLGSGEAAPTQLAAILAHVKGADEPLPDPGLQRIGAAQLLLLNGQPAEAAAEFRAAQGLMGPEDRRAAYFCGTFALAEYARSGDAAVLEDALALTLRQFGPAHPRVPMLEDALRRHRAVGALQGQVQ